MKTQYILDRIQATIEYMHEHDQLVDRVEVSKWWYEILKAESDNNAAPKKVFGYPLVKNVELFDYIVVTSNWNPT